MLEEEKGMVKDYGIILRVATTYIGAIIGAGFASGQEILQFFSLQGTWGYLGIIICGSLFAILGYMLLAFSLQYNLRTYNQLFYKLGSKKLGSFADTAILFFLFASFVVMLSGSGEIFISYFHLNKSIGILLTFMIIISAIKFGIEGVMNLNMFLIPGLIIIIAITFFFNVNTNLNGTFPVPIYADSILNNWFLQALVYVIYNFFLALPVLIAIPTRIKEKKLLKRGSILAGLLLAILALVIDVLLVQNLSFIKDSQMPILKILSYKNLNLYFFYSLVLWLSMITTATSSLYGLLTRLIERLSISENKLLLIITVLGFLLAKFRFDSLVMMVYPFLGNIGILIILCLFFNYFKYKIII